MHCKISAKNYAPPYGKGSCAWIFIDEQPIQSWVAENLKGSDSQHLALAQIWLIDDEEDKLSKSRIRPEKAGTSTIVPILVCSDDMDLRCTVIVVEQVIGSDYVEWKRFGLSWSTGMEVGISTSWFDSEFKATFHLDEFNSALNEFEDLITKRIKLPPTLGDFAPL
jgi:hypothetical protein